MNSPEMTLENLELAAVGEQTLASESNGTNEGFEHLLTLRFKALKPGDAKIQSLTLTWTQADGLSTSQLKIPAVEFKISKKNVGLIRWIVMGNAVLGLLIILISVSASKHRKKKISIPEVPLEEKTLVSLEKAMAGWKNTRDHKLFLQEMTKIVHLYLKQKLDWNQGQEDYNALQNKAEKIWDKSQIREMKELMQNLEFKRFSGTIFDPQEISSLFQSAHSFIERKKIVN